MFGARDIFQHDSCFNHRDAFFERSGAMCGPTLRDVNRLDWPKGSHSARGWHMRISRQNGDHQLVHNRSVSLFCLAGAQLDRASVRT
jgi:hypothetical protein